MVRTVVTTGLWASLIQTNYPTCHPSCCMLKTRHVQPESSDVQELRWWNQKQHSFKSTSYSTSQTERTTGFVL